MKTTVIVLVLTLTAGAVVALADDKAGLSDPSVKPSEAQGFRIVQGEVLKMEGNTYLIRDETGKEIRLIVTRDSKINKAFEVGDRIVAQVSDQGVVTLINKSDTPPGAGIGQNEPQQKEGPGGLDTPRQPSGKMPQGSATP